LSVLLVLSALEFLCSALLLAPSFLPPLISLQEKCALPKKGRLADLRTSIS
jgi:hypothetical protein